MAHHGQESRLRFSGEFSAVFFGPYFGERGLESLVEEIKLVGDSCDFARPFRSNACVFRARSGAGKVFSVFVNIIKNFFDISNDEPSEKLAKIK